MDYSKTMYEDWVPEDPAGQVIESVRVIRDEIKARVEALLSELLPAERAGRSPRFHIK